MAQAQGICKNCGSLILLNDKDELCECLFCDCVFPSAEAIEIAKNPGDYTFPKEPQPKRDSGVKRFNMTPVYPDPVPAAIKRAEAVPQKKATEKNPYEVSPDDIKTPRKVLITIIGTAVLVIALCVGVAWPLYAVRMGHRDALSQSVGEALTEFKVDTSASEGYGVGYAISGQSNNVLAVTTDEEVTKDQVLKTFENFASVRADEYKISKDDFGAYYGGIRLTVYAGNGGFQLDINSADQLTSDSVTELS